MNRTALGLLLGAALASGCTHLKANKTVCEEYRSLRCATAPECSMDAARGCQVCQCAPAAANAEGFMPSGLPPDRR